MTPLDALLGYVLPEVPDCPTPTVQNAIRDAAMEFCEATHVWQVQLAPIDAIARMASYDLVVPDDKTRIVQVRDVKFAGERVDPMPPDELSTDGGFTRSRPWYQETAACPDWYFQVARTQLRLVPMPNKDAEGAIEVRVSVKPTLDAAQISDAVANDWYAALAHGAKAKLFAYRGKPWSEASLAGFHGRMFETAKRQAHAETVRGNTRNDRATGRTRLWV